jgi:long-chain acyl-CoA synthetase
METTFPRLLLQHAAQRPQAAAMREKEYGIWQALTWADLARMVEQVGQCARRNTASGRR